MDIITALQATSQGLSVLKQLRDIEKQFDVATLKIQIAELAEALTTARLTLVEAQEELAKKDGEIAILKRNFEKVADTVEHEGFHYDKGEGDQPTGLPYCPRCQTLNGILMRVTRVQSKQRGTVCCPHCKAEYSHVHSM
jgi:superfamily II helicase